MGEIGIQAVNRLAKSGMLGFRTAVLCREELLDSSRADFRLSSKYDFLDNCDKFFVTPNTAVFVLLDLTQTIDVSLACELASITAIKGGFSVAVAWVPSSNEPRYDIACESLEELHDVFSGVVRFNAGYTDSFENETVRLFEVLYRAMDSEALVGLEGFSEMKSLFTQPNDIYFASTASHELMDSHGYNAKCLELKLCHQTYVDTANYLMFFYSCGTAANHQLIDVYRKPIKNMNIAFLNSTKTYISDHNLELGEGEFVFAVMCAK